MVERVSVPAPVIAVPFLLVMVALCWYFGGALVGGAVLPFLISLVTIWTEQRVRWGQITLTALGVVSIVVVIVGASQARSTERDLDRKGKQLELTSKTLQQTQMELSSSHVQLDKTTNDFEKTNRNLKRVEADLVAVAAALDKLAEDLEKRGAKVRAAEVRTIREKAIPYVTK